MNVYLSMGLLSLTAGIVQSVTGFGAGIILMLLLPHYMPMNVAPIISNGTTLPLSWSIAWRYRKVSRHRATFLPLIIYILVSAWAIHISSDIQLGLLQQAFGFFLVLLSLYYLCFSGKIHLKESTATVVICGILSGLMGGFFGISGPPLAIYYLAISSSKEEYLGTLNFLFAVASTYQVFARMSIGLFSSKEIPLLLVCITAIMVGRYIGSHIVNRINANQLKKFVYVFLGFSGIVTIIRCL